MEIKAKLEQNFESENSFGYLFIIAIFNDGKKIDLSSSNALIDVIDVPNVNFVLRDLDMCFCFFSIGDTIQQN